MNFSKPYDYYVGKWFKGQTNAYGFIYKVLEDSTVFRIRFLDLQPGGDITNGWSIKNSVEKYEPTEADYRKAIINIFKL